MPERSSQTVLCFGHDEILQKTRQWLVESIGSRCLNVTSLAEYLDVLIQLQPAIIVLCHSLSPDEREDALHLAKQNSPASTTLVLYRMASKPLSSRRQVSFDATDGPEAFVHAVKQLIGPSA